ncbi:bZIP_ATF6 domain-containing protein ATf6 isoform X2 [Musca autumnalis]|uniref:bZIP_ATF6 domain-containing protein ATf6 isoform X2 n=1 Tax=Musca autumnalis TaxID=221902 RepID=UPI003CF64A3E
MDVDNDNFYDEIASFMPQPGDYSLDDLDEIIRSTDSHLDASFDLNAFPKTSLGSQNDDCEMGEPPAINGQHATQSPQPQMIMTSENPPADFHFDFSAFPSPATSQQSSGDYVSPFDTPARTSSTSSVDGDYFNPDDFINFLNDDDAKFEDLTQDTIRKLNQHNERNTPSPTGSCTSSSGSSTTSGVHSDSSSLFSVPRNGSEHLATSPEHEQQDDLSEFIRFKNEKSENSNGFDETVEDEINAAAPAINEDDATFVAPSPLAGTVALQTNPTFIPVTLPVVPVTTLQPVQSVNIVPGVPGAILPVAVPVTKVTPVVNIKTPAKPVVIQNHTSQQSQNVKVVSAPSVNGNATKVTAPPNPKPKTIFLSSNDFKALMQKVNTTNGTSGGAKKPTTTPKIIMKTASGKFITANKISQATTSSASAQQQQSSANKTGVPTTISLQNGAKLVKTVGQNPMAMKSQHHQQQLSKMNNNHHNSNVRSAAAMAAARATLSSLTAKSSRADLSSLRDFSGGDDKILKKQLRMLKNRESASLSRKKKKEYVERLENRIHNLEKENYSLKGENTSLRSQLMAFAQSCNCKNRNVSEFILKTLNMNERNHFDGSGAKSVLNALDTSFLLHSCDDSSDHSEHGDVPTSTSSSSSSTKHHVKIAPKPLNGTSSTSSFINKGFKHRMTAATVKKNVAVLFAMAFMVTLNVGNFQNYLNKSTALENAMEASAAAAAANANEGGETPLVAPTGRRLLWVPSEHEFMEQTNRTKREADFANMPPPPLHFLRPVNRTTGRLNGTTTKDEPPIKIVEFGPTNYGNMTNCAQENMRLARNLHKWIGDNGYLNMTAGTIDNDITGRQFNFGSADKDYVEVDYDIGVKQKRKIYLNGDGEDHLTVTKQKKYDMGMEANSLDIFKPRISEEYLRLFKGIKRQDDTFYVLSFNMDHLLLPAQSYNKSARPKMALMLPAGDPSINGDIVLMQIDCEVMNTTELKIKSHMIPEKLRPVKYGPNVRVHPTDVANNETKNNNESSGAAKPSAAAAGEIHLKREDDKVVMQQPNEKPSQPTVKVYTVVGPKNQQQQSSTPPSGNVVNKLVVDTAAIKRRPLKFNANDSVIGSGVLNVRNSSLFTRMKETVINGATNGFVATAAPEMFTT